MAQEQLNQFTRLKNELMIYQLTGTRYLLKDDGSIVLRYPDGKEGPLPEYCGCDDE